LLTGDLVRVRKKAGAIVPQYLNGEARIRLFPLARYYDDTLATLVGSSRDDVNAALAALDVPARDRVAALGLKKLLEDKATFEIGDGPDPEELRAEVFAAAAAQVRAMEVRAAFDRQAVLTEIALKRGVSIEAIERRIYADLRGSELLQGYERTPPEVVLGKYDVALAQAVLLRATKVVVKVDGQEPALLKQLFRAARFHGLLHVVHREGDATVITLDGPFSLFDAVNRYGLRLALFLPHVLACSRFHLSADVLWGKERLPHTFEIKPEDGLVGAPIAVPATGPDLEVFAAAFDRLESEWKARPNDRVFALPGEVVCVPDLVFENTKTGEEIYLEAFGFWSRAAVWARVELLRAGAPIPIILAVGKQLRVSDQVLEEDSAGEVYVYKTTPSPRAILERLRLKATRRIKPKSKSK
jgi:predicted nuclease of restriction endonuclease-like RecB superfamily